MTTNVMAKGFAVSLILGVVGWALFAACATTPVTERRQLMMVSTEQMQQLGAEAYAEVLKKYPRSENARLTEAVTTIGQNLAEASGVDFDWEFHVLESEEINAFCLPGGKIAVFTGLFKVARSNADLAAVLGHEIAHATAHHGAERVSQAFLAQGALAVANVALEDNPQRNTILAALGLGAQVGIMLPYSRKHELEADHIGTIYAARAGYDPHAAVQVWREMAEQAESLPLEILSTHPDPGRRAERLAHSMNQYVEIREKSGQVPSRGLPLQTKMSE